MSKNKGFSSTSADRYSLALYELAEESNSLTQIEQNSFALLDLISNDKNFRNFIKDPSIKREILISVINKIKIIRRSLINNFLSTYFRKI